MARVLENFRRKPTTLEKYIDLAGLHDRNEALFFRVLIDHPDEMTADRLHADGGARLPAVRPHLPAAARPLRQRAATAAASREVLRQLAAARRRDHRGHRRRAHPRPGRPRRQRHGHPGRQARALHRVRGRATRTCACRCCSTSAPTTRELPQRPALHRPAAAAADAAPTTTRWSRSSSPRRARLFPGVVIQFEDFANHNAFRLLEKYRDRIPTFNDDIQGTAAVTLAGILSALRVTGGKLAEQTILFQGAGEAATGIANLAVSAMVARGADAEAARAPLLAGRLARARGRRRAPTSRTTSCRSRTSMRRSPTCSARCRRCSPTAIIGVAAVGGAFTQRGARGDGARINERPIVFALSNPTSKSECTARAGLHRDRRARALRLRQPVRPGDARRQDASCRARATTRTSSPAWAWARSSARTSRITDEMFMAAARTLPSWSTEADLAQGSLYPPLSRVREVVGAHRRGGRRDRLRRAARRRAASRPTCWRSCGRSMYEPQYAELRARTVSRCAKPSWRRCATIRSSMEFEPRARRAARRARARRALRPRPRHLPRGRRVHRVLPDRHRARRARDRGARAHVPRADARSRATSSAGRRC